MSDVVRESVAVYGAKLRPMTVKEYYLAAESGVFRPNERLELIHGEVIQLSPQDSPHASTTTYVDYALRRAFKDVCIRVQLPLRLDDLNEPEPDVLVAKGPLRAYEKSHPGAGDVLLIVEVADTSVSKDRILKSALYAEFKIVEYWILNVGARHLEVFREPGVLPDGSSGYLSSQIVLREGSVSPLLAEGRTISVADLLPL